MLRVTSAQVSTLDERHHIQPGTPWHNVGSNTDAIRGDPEKNTFAVVVWVSTSFFYSRFYDKVSPVALIGVSCINGRNQTLRGKGASEPSLNIYIRIWATHHQQPEVRGRGLANLCEGRG